MSLSYLCYPCLEHHPDDQRGRTPPRKESGCMRIEFPPGETDDPARWMVWFLAVVNGKHIHCGISYQALRTHCAAEFQF
jgi:hypothetical protein